MFKISITKPCNENWDNMSPNGVGRYCTACEKTVVDFSVMNDDEVQQYIINNFEQKICGRFKNVQLERIVIDLPQNIFHIRLPFWKKFLVASLIIFGSTFFSIDATIAGVSYNTSNTFYSGLQGEPVIKKQNKPRTKKKRRRKQTWVYIPTINLDIQDIVLGGFGMPLDDRKLICINDPFQPKQDLLSYIEKPDKGNNKANILPSEGSKPVTPKPEPQPEKAIYVLPAALALRNPFSKKKKA